MSTTARYKDYTAFNGDITINGGALGEMVSVTASANFSLVPPTTFSKYYNVYEVTAETTITITLPSPTNVTLGWYCRISLISATGAGKLLIVDHLGADVATLDSNTSFGKVRASVTLTLVEATPAWCEAYSVPSVGGTLQMIASNTYPTYKQFNFGLLFSRCSSAVDVNSLIDVALPWNNATNLTFDSEYYSFAGGNSRVNSLISGVYHYSCIIGIANTLLATQTNLLIRPRINGTTFVSSFIVFASTIQPFTDGVYWLDCEVYMTAGSYLEIMVGKSLISVGTNPVDNVNTCIYAEYISQS